MKTIILLVSALIMSNTHACFAPQDKYDYDEAKIVSYARFNDACNSNGNYHILPFCERDYAVCFESTLKTLEKNFDCKKSPVIVHRAANTCLGDFI